jgi:predicted nucleic acid-binding protein
MSRVFADTFYFLALLNQNDAAHGQALQFSESHDPAIVTTAWVLTEVANGLSQSAHRGAFARLLNNLKADANSIIVPPSEPLFEMGVELYCARPDKDWSLTDCISFVVMEEHDLSEALTADHHFEQAGFRTLLR